MIDSTTPRAAFQYVDEAIHWLETKLGGRGLILNEENMEVYPENREVPTYIEKWDRVDFSSMRKRIAFALGVDNIPKEAEVVAAHNGLLVMKEILSKKELQRIEKIMEEINESTSNKKVRQLYQDANDIIEVAKERYRKQK